LRNLLDETEPLISELITKKQLTVREIFEALIKGKRLKVMKAPKGVNFYLEDNILKSDTISHTKGLPMDFFNEDIKFEVDE